MPLRRRPELPSPSGSPRVAMVVVVVLVVAWVGARGCPGLLSAGAQTGEPSVGVQLPEPEPDPDDVRAEADRILAGEEYGRDDAGDTGGPLPDGGSGGRPPEPPAVPQPPAFAGLGTVGQVVMWILVVALVTLAVWVIARAVIARRRGTDDDEDGEDDDIAVVDDGGDDLDPMLQPADEWRRLAGVAEAEDRWRDGLRYRYRALVADLITGQVVDDLPGRTTGEYRVEVAAGLPGVGPDFAQASELFDRAWYGARSTGADERDRFVACEGRVLADVTAGSDR